LATAVGDVFDDVIVFSLVNGPPEGYQTLIEVL